LPLERKILHRIKKSLAVVIILLFYSSSQAQLFNPDYWRLRKEWGFKEFERANTARFSLYMGRTQKRTILLMNLARQDGRKFSDLVIKPYVEENPDKKEFLIDLNAKDLPMLRPSLTLTMSALIHTIPSGLFGYMGHQGFNARMLAFGNWYFPTGENCSYGYYRPINVVLQLLNSRGHRANILSKDYARVGVAHFAHIRTLWNSVTTFGGPKFFDFAFRDFGNKHHYQANFAILPSARYTFLDLSFGKRYLNDVGSARWNMGCEMFLKNGVLRLNPKFSWISEVQYFGLGTNIVYLKNHMGGDNFILRPEVSFRFPFTFKISRFSRSYSVFDIFDSRSALVLSLGYNIGLLNHDIGVYSPRMFHISYSKNFGFSTKKKK
jgi:hypothetical protein